MLEHFFDELGTNADCQKLAIISTTDSISYQDLVKKVNLATNALAKHHVERLVAIILPNSIITCVIILACLKAKMTFVSIDAGFPTNEIKKILAQLKPASIIGDVEWLSKVGVELACPLFSPETILSTIGDHDHHHYATLYPDNEESFVALTSGSTGTVKGVVHTNFSLCEAIQNVLTSLQLTVSHRLLCAISHPSNAFLRNMLACLIKGATFILAYDKDFQIAFDLIKRYQPTHIRFSIKDLIALSQQPSSQLITQTLKSIERCDVSGDVIPLDIINAVNKLLGTGVLITSYAMSECSTIAVNQTTKDPAYQYLTGKAIDSVQIKIIDEAGDEILDASVGELLVKSNTMFKCYLHDIKETARVFTADGWFKTGDYFSRDKHDYLAFAGRKKNIIIKDGKNLNPEYIRKIILQWPEIVDCVVVGEPSIKALHEPVAYCSVNNDGGNIDIPAFKNYLKENLNPNWIPQNIIIMSDLPRTPFGKINLSYIAANPAQLRAEAQARIICI